MRRFALRVLVLLPLAAAGACSVVGYPGGAPPAVPASATPAPAASNPSPPRRSDAGRTYEIFGVRYKVMDSSVGYREEGLASWYGPQFHGRPTASGETFDQHAVSAAHRTLPLHTWVQVTNLSNGRRVVLRINDRGPFARTDERIIDLSYGAARELGIVAAGIAPVEVRALQPDEVAVAGNR